MNVGGESYGETEACTGHGGKPPASHQHSQHGHRRPSPHGCQLRARRGPMCWLEFS